MSRRPVPAPGRRWNSYWGRWSPWRQSWRRFADTIAELACYLPSPTLRWCAMSKSDRLSRILQVYLAGELELETAVAEVTHVYIRRGWRFVLIETDCQPQYRERMRVLAARVKAEVLPA